MYIPKSAQPYMPKSAVEESTDQQSSNPIQDLWNATAETGQAWGRVPSQLLQAFQGKPITPNPELSPSAQQGMGMIQGAMIGGPSNIGVKNAVSGVKQAPKVTKSAVEVVKSIPYLSKGGTYRAMEKTVGQATAKGVLADGDELATLMKDAVNKKFLNISEAKSVLQKITSSIPGTQSKKAVAGSKIATNGSWSDVVERIKAQTRG